MAVNSFNAQNPPVTTKGDLFTFSTIPTRLGVGANNTVLTADSSTATGLKWATPSSPSFKGCRVFSTTNQTISNTTYTSITYNSESYDTDNFHSTSTNTSRITIPAGLGGYYLITGRLVFVANSTGVRVMRFMINGTTGYVKAIAPAINNDDTSVAMTEILNLSAGDYIELQAYQNSGGNLSTNQDSSSFLGMAVQYLGA